MMIDKFLQQLQEYNDTDFMCYNLDFLKNIVENIKSQFKGITIMYAMKANYDVQVLNVMKNHNIGVDCASYEEFKIAQKLGFELISCTGPGYTSNEIKDILDNNALFDFDSLKQLEDYLKNNSEGVEELGIRLSYNKGHLGIKIDDILERQHLFINIKRLHIHYGHKTLENLKEVLSYLENIVLYNKHIFRNVTSINLGGSFEGLYRDKYIHNMQMMFSKFEYSMAATLGHEIKIFIEPGDMFARPIGFYKSEIVTSNQNKVILKSSVLNFCPWYPKRLHISLDMNQSLDPVEYLVCGNSCFEGDIFGKIISYRNISDDDSIIIYPTGSYNFNMTRYIHNRMPNNKIIYFKRGSFFESDSY